MKECIASYKMQTPPQKCSAKYGIKVALMIAKQQECTFTGNILLAPNADSEEYETKYSAGPTRKPVPYLAHYCF
jgi:hypothetical protein